MEDFQTITRNRRSAVWGWLLGALAVAVVGSAAVGAVAFGAIPASRAALGFGGDPDPRVEAVPTAVSSPEEESAFGTGEPINVLILGVDERPRGDEEELGTRSDTIMLAHVEPATGEIAIVSVPRDLYVEVAPGVPDKINAAYAYDGIEGTAAALQRYGGISIDHYAVVDFRAFRTIINAMGGLEVEVQSDIPELGLTEGLQTLEGNKALLYARYRGTEGGDLDRIRRQQQVVAALRGKALRWDSLSKVPTFASIVSREVETDLGVDEGAAVGRAMLQNGEDATMTATQLSGTPYTLPDGTEVLLPDDEENERLLAPFQY